ncbi:DgyrCDS4081 [Dimorphilus gyrociliatus]|uniref:DgyrCDS4081 n=1 Tax=Dimorphilus gyrociliatus TaxID=2664684 RepID=A0A7I8VFJ7_9ANNE|nr:DgyrCDS4081 [Dimorphilus gyrociliatus]
MENKRKRKKPSSKSKTINKIKEKDPEFYKFLQNEDKELLDFEDIDEDDNVSEEEGGVHEVPDKLSEISDDDSDSNEDDDVDDDDDDDDDNEGANKVILSKKTKASKQKLIKSSDILSWKKRLEDGKDSSINSFIKEIIMTLKAVVVHYTSNELETSYKITAPKAITSVLDCCINDIPETFNKFLKFHPKRDTDLASSSSKWNKFKVTAKTYISCILQLISASQPDVQLQLIKHLTVMAPYICSTPKTAKITIKKLISIWSRGEDSCRLACVLTLARMNRIDKRLTDYILKAMYSSYVSNCKFISANSLPAVNMMRRSLAEMFAMNQEKAYNYAFVYIRQLAILLRNAITNKKKESYESVYNWQYVQSLSLWTLLVSRTYPSTILKPLIYPLTQLIVGIIKLLPISRYYPLRFHMIRLLNELSSSTETFIPVLPYILESLENVDLNAKTQSSGELKHFNWSTILKLSKSQLKERSFKDGLIEECIDALMDHLRVHSHSVAFPELVLPLSMQLKKLTKTVKVANYTKKLKSIIDKVEENCKDITNRRKRGAIDLRNAEGVKQIENKWKEDGTVFSKYYEGWRKVRDKQLALRFGSNIELTTSEGLAIGNSKDKSNNKMRKATKAEREEFESLFANGDEDYSDLDDEELEELDQSCSDEDSDAEYDDGKNVIKAKKRKLDKDEDSDNEDDDDNGDGDDDDDDDDDEDDIVEDLSLSDDSD